VLNIVATGKPSDGLFFYSCEHYFKLASLGIDVQLIVFTHRHHTEDDYTNNIAQKYTKSIPIVFNDYDPDHGDVNLIMGRSMLTLAYKTWKDYDVNQQFCIMMLFGNPLISVYSENHTVEYDEAVEFFHLEGIYDLCDHDVYPNGVGEQFEKYIHFDNYKDPVDDIQFKHLFLGTTPEYYEWAKESVDKYPDYAILTYKETDLNTIVAPVKNLMGVFDTYVYVKKTFDPAPRILQECWHYGKNIVVDRPVMHDGGSVYIERGARKPNVEPIVRAYDEIQRLGH
jgi:hypothetical protein